MTEIVSLHYYPIKGFAGRVLDEVTLRVDHGIIGDRGIGIKNGLAGGDDAAFHQLATRPGLTSYKPGDGTDGIKLFGPEGGFERDILGDPGRVRNEFGEDAEVVSRHDGLGHWDYPDAMLSIVNVETIKVLSGLVGTDLDPLRFRANIYINAEPFTEFTWLGRGIWTGDALLSIIRPMRRCSATSVNPNSGARDVNVPAQLMKHFGSMFCGIYANVERQGTVRRGTGVSLSEHKFPERLPAAAQVKKAPPPAEWPRSATVCAVEREAEDVISIWLEDPLVRSGSLDDLVPGQHLALHGLSQKGDWRRYTISGRREGHLRITVKRDTGVGSNFLHKLKVGQLVTISGPFGPTTLNPESRAVMLISAGIGLTPTITKLAALERSGYERSVHVIHVARSAAQLALWDEVLSMAERQPSWTTRLYLTRDTMGRPAAIEGKPDMTDLIQAAIRLEADVHMCGPTGFQRVVETVAAETGLPSDRLFFDTFASPNASTEFLPIPESGPFTVHFSKSGFSAKWSAEDGPLLDFAERNGLALPAHCRAGLCSTCRCSVIEGSARNLVSGAGNADQGVLLCCSVPVSDIVLDV